MGFYNRHILPRVLDLVMRRASLRPQRQWLLPQARGEALEMGFGGGLNLPFYPRDVRAITAVEPDAAQRARAMARIEASGRTVSLLASGMDQRLPLPDASFDTVVSTWTLCTIPDPVAALKEAFRLLRPGGRFLFVEHGLSPDNDVAAWQRRLNRVTQRWGGGCNLDRDIETIVRRSRFRLEKCEKFYLPDALRVGGFTYRGTAVKD